MKLLVAILLVLFLSPVNFYASSQRVNILKDVFHYNQNSKRSIELSELVQGCANVNCMIALNQPEFVAIDAINFIRDDDVMMFVDYNGVQKAYSRKIMQRHEIVNDYYADKPLAMTYCPLCGSSIAFIPILDGQPVEFGVSGLLHNSDLVMYDRKTASLWGQITGRSIVGPKTGERLKSVSVSLMRWKQLKKDYPKALVLALPQVAKYYNRFRYRAYTKSRKLMFPVAFKDGRLATKQFVYGIEIDGTYIAFEEKNLISQSPLVESYGQRILQVSYNKGAVTAIDKKTGESFDALRVYWFAWYAFHPETQLRK